jgi:hypothetical protein
VLHGEQCVVCIAHVAEAKLYGVAVRRGCHHHVSNDPGYIELLLRLFTSLFLSYSLNIR